MVVQQKTKTPVQFEITPGTRDSLLAHISNAKSTLEDYLFKSRLSRSEHFSTRQYARILKRWVADIGLDPSVYATHSMRRTKLTPIYKRTKNLRAVQLLLGYTKLEAP
jgi:site-specific recombinase XerD